MIVQTVYPPLKFLLHWIASKLKKKNPTSTSSHLLKKIGIERKPKERWKPHKMEDRSHIGSLNPSRGNDSRDCRSGPFRNISANDAGVRYPLSLSLSSI